MNPSFDWIETKLAPQLLSKEAMSQKFRPFYRKMVDNIKDIDNYEVSYEDRHRTVTGLKISLKILRIKI